MLQECLLWIVRPPVDSAKWISGGASRLNLDLQTDSKTLKHLRRRISDAKMVLGENAWWERLVRTSAKPMSSNWFGLNRISCKMLVSDTAHGTHYTQHAHYSGCPLRRALIYHMLITQRVPIYTAPRQLVSRINSGVDVWCVRERSCFPN